MLPFRSCTAIQQAFTVFESFNLSQGACLCKALCRSCNQQCLETLGKMMTCFFFSVRLDSKTLVCFEWNMEMSLKNGLRSYQSKRKSGLKKSFNLNKSWVTLQYQWRGESCDTRYSGCLKTGQTKKSTPKSFIADTTSISMISASLVFSVRWPENLPRTWTLGLVEALKGIGIVFKDCEKTLEGGHLPQVFFLLNVV